MKGISKQKRLAVCIGCGCDDLHACPGGCWWLRVDYDEGRGVCSECKACVAAWDNGDHNSHAPKETESESSGKKS